MTYKVAVARDLRGDKCATGIVSEVAGIGMPALQGFRIVCECGDAVEEVSAHRRSDLVGLRASALRPHLHETELRRRKNLNSETDILSSCGGPIELAHHNARMSLAKEFCTWPSNRGVSTARMIKWKTATPNRASVPSNGHA